MRLLFLALLLALSSCAADPVMLPDSGPCSSACGTGTVCLSGSCVAVDAGAVEAGVRCTPGTQGTCACLPGSMRAVYVCPASGVPPETCPCSEDVDGAVRDVQVVDLGVPDTGHDAGRMDTGATDAGAVDTGSDVPADTYGACLANGIRECDGRNVFIQLGEVDGGRTYHCGGCGITCAAGEFCLRCRCQR